MICHSESTSPLRGKCQAALRTKQNAVEVKVQNLLITNEANHLGLTHNMELDDLLGMEGADADSADVGAVIANLHPVQGHGGVALSHQERGVHAGACSTFACWRRAEALREAPGLPQKT